MGVAPGTYTVVTTAPSSPNGNAATGVWYVTGQTQMGPTGVAIPVTSMSDYANFLGTRVSYGFLYDSLNEFFNDGGVLAYASRVVGPSAGTAQVVIPDRGGTPQNTLTVAASGAGSWGNALSVIVANGSASNSYTLQIVNNGVVVPGGTSPNLFVPNDAVVWFNAQNVWQIEVVIANDGSTNSEPTNNPAVGTYTLTGGTDDTADVTDTQWTNALTAFPPSLGPGQVSAPGHTTQTGYLALAAHAQANNRVALLDVADSASAATLVAQAAAVQAAAPDPSYAAMFAPWVIIPGITSTNPGTTSPVPTRTIPPSALVAAQIAAADQGTGSANVPAAGSLGTSTYAIGVTQTFSTTDLGTLNSAGVDVIKIINNSVTVFGYRSLALDPNWVFFNNVRFRMQIINDFDIIGNQFVFSQIDGKGQVFAALNGALAGKCQQYWTEGSLYGATVSDAFTINTGAQVNTPTTIAAGQINAQVSLVMSPFAEVVIIDVIKYTVNSTLPPAPSAQ
jgi:hypothetical protein